MVSVMEVVFCRLLHTHCRLMIYKQGKRLIVKTRDRDNNLIWWSICHNSYRVVVRTMRVRWMLATDERANRATSARCGPYHDGLARLNVYWLEKMGGFRIRRHFSLHRFNMEGGGLIARLGMKPRVKRRAMQSLRALQVAIAEKEAQNMRIREANELWLRWIREANTWVEHLLPVIQNDPSIRDAIEKLNEKKN
ncbi:hypothetical protein V6N13_014955 [Hibiscus sabdariffa]